MTNRTRMPIETASLGVPHRLGLRQEAERHAALASCEAVGGGRRETPLRGKPKRCRRCALPPQSKAPPVVGRALPHWRFSIHRSLQHWLWSILLASLALTKAAECCTVPVFRYALDRWQADAYRLEFPASALSDPKLADFFRTLGTDSPVNLEAKSGSSTEARLLVPHPEEAKSPVVWSGALTAASLAALTDSPARKEIARRVLAGESVVWVLAESGNKTEDDAIAARVEKRLRYLEQVAILPRIDPNDPTSKLGPGPALRVKFSLLRVPSAALEAAFLKMLAGPKPAAELATGPWLAAVFGRGRVLGAWPAADFGDAEIEEACLFLLGACSCQVKRQNPGWDLLMNVNWDGELRAVAEKAGGSTPASAPAPVAPVSPNPANATETVTIASAPLPAQVVNAESPSNLRIWLGAAACAVIGLFLFTRRN